MLISRIAPTPSGYLHIGNLISFLQTWLIVRSQNGKLLLRIDDLDSLRVQDEFLHDIFDTLAFLEIDYDLGPRNILELRNEYSQNLRIEQYQKAMAKLKLDGQIYGCTCSRKIIASNSDFGRYPRFCRDKKTSLNRVNVAWRIRLPLRYEVNIKDEIHQKVETVKLSDVMSDFIIRRKDGLPAYQIASLVDDELYGVNYVVRGKDLFTSSAAQIYLSKLLNYQFHLSSRFFHHELLRSKDDVKLSKSAGAYSIFQMRKEGFKKEEILGILGTHLGFKKREVKSPLWFLDNFDKIDWK